MLSVIIDGKDEKTGEKFSDQLIKDSIMTLLLAGFETTGTAIPHVLLYLAKVLYNTHWYNLTQESAL